MQRVCRYRGGDMGRWRRGFGLKGGKRMGFINVSIRTGTQKGRYLGATRQLRRAEERRDLKCSGTTKMGRWDAITIRESNAPLPVLPPFAESRWQGGTASYKMCGQVQDNAWKHGHGPKRTGGVAFWLLLRKTPYQAAARAREGPSWNASSPLESGRFCWLGVAVLLGCLIIREGTQLISWAVYFVGEREGR